MRRVRETVFARSTVRLETDSCRRAWNTCRLLLSPKSGSRRHVSGLPTEEIIDAGPGVDLGLANLAAETAGTGFRVLLFGRGVIDPAIGAGVKFGGPDAVCHAANMRRAPPIFQHRTLPPLMTHYPRMRLAAGWDLLPINLP